LGLELLDQVPLVARRVGEIVAARQPRLRR
jgi:hypothetical protein